MVFEPGCDVSTSDKVSCAATVIVIDEEIGGMTLLNSLLEMDVELKE
jgi:hypothetical protein